MTPPKKQPDRSTAAAPVTTPAPSSPQAAGSTSQSGRKPWVKKTPAEVVIAQIERVREDVEQREEELKRAKLQLEKLEQAKRILEST